jgi:hypothetical protein
MVEGVLPLTVHLTQQKLHHLTVHPFNINPTHLAPGWSGIEKSRGKRIH